MKKSVISILLIALIVVSCTSNENEAPAEIEGTFYGEQFVPTNVVLASSIIPNLTEEPTEKIQVRGNVVEVCQSKGCWLALELDGAETMRMTFKDYDFFVPLDLAGAEIIAEGEAWLNNTSVNALRHYAEDAGQTEEEIAAITSDKVEFYFEASGVLVQ